MTTPVQYGAPEAPASPQFAPGHPYGMPYAPLPPVGYVARPSMQQPSFSQSPMSQSPMSQPPMSQSPVSQPSVRSRGGAMSSIQPSVQLAAVVLAGLVAGLLLAFAVAVMPGLAKLDDQTFVSTMRAINVAILNPVFLLLWMGAPLLAVLTAVLSIRSKEAVPWAIAGALLTIATFVITAAINIPLNDALAATTNVHAARAAFEQTWVIANIARVLTGIGGCACLAWVLRVS